MILFGVRACRLVKITEHFPNFMARKTLITGIVGQDGSYLLELSPAKGCEVHGIVRRTAPM